MFYLIPFLFFQFLHSNTILKEEFKSSYFFTFGNKYITGTLPSSELSKDTQSILFLSKVILKGFPGSNSITFNVGFFDIKSPNINNSGTLLL